MIDDDYLDVPRSPRQPPWFLLTGLVLGLGIGLLISIVIFPVRYTETAPSSLAAEYKDNYRWLIARAYQANGDLIRAGQRLALLGDANPQEALAAQAQRMLAAGESVEDARVLADLAAALVAAAQQPTQAEPTAPPAGAGTEPGQPPAAHDLSAQTASPGQPARTPMPTFTPRANQSPLPTLGAPFVLDAQREVCDPAQAEGLLQIELKDAQGQPAAGVQIVIAWDGGLDTFYTGLKPTISPGYADFVMTAGVEYSLRVGGSSETVKGLLAPQCSTDSGSYLGGLRLEFNQR
jgi:hypothetical protein